MRVFHFSGAEKTEIETAKEATQKYVSFSGVLCAGIVAFFSLREGEYLAAGFLGLVGFLCGGMLGTIFQSRLLRRRFPKYEEYSRYKTADLDAAMKRQPRPTYTHLSRAAIEQTLSQVSGDSIDIAGDFGALLERLNGCPKAHSILLLPHKKEEIEGALKEIEIASPDKDTRATAMIASVFLPMFMDDQTARVLGIELCGCVRSNSSSLNNS